MELMDEVTGTAAIGQAANAAPLANRKAPYYVVQKEAPVHRLMLEYAAQGYDVKEIAEMTGRTPVCVNNILRQEHAQQNLVNTIKKNVNEDREVVEIIKRNVIASAKLYENTLRDEKIGLDTRLDVAERFLCRRYGKPTQPMAQGTVVDLNDLSDDQLAAMINSTSGTATGGAPPSSDGQPTSQEQQVQ